MSLRFLARSGFNTKNVLLEMCVQTIGWAVGGMFLLEGVSMLISFIVKTFHKPHAGINR